MPKSHIPRNRKARTTKPRRKLHALEVLADKANQLSLDELQEIFNEYLPVSNVDGVEKDENRTWTFIDGPSLKSTPELKDQVWTLFEANMHDIYIQANDPDIPWDPVQKHKELDHKKTRLVLVRAPNSESLDAFCSFRFEAEHDENGDMRFLVYIYEIQVAHGRRGTGIFRRMLTALEGMCVELGVQVIMLTCFKCNTQALPVYTHLGFKEVDDESETSQEFWKPVSV